MAVGFLSPVPAITGLTLVKTQTVGTAVTSVQVTNAFSATYDNYRILYTDGVAATSNALRLALDGITGSNYYSALVYQSFGSGTITGTATFTSYWDWAGGGSSTGVMFDFTLFNPYLTKYKYGYAYDYEPGTTGVNGQSKHYLNSNASATGFTISTPPGGSLTGGTIRVYGFQNS